MKGYDAMRKKIEEYTYKTITIEQSQKIITL